MGSFFWVSLEGSRWNRPERHVPQQKQDDPWASDCASLGSLNEPFDDPVLPVSGPPAAERCCFIRSASSWSTRVTRLASTEFPAGSSSTGFEPLPAVESSQPPNPFLAAPLGLFT